MSLTVFIFKTGINQIIYAKCKYCLAYMKNPIHVSTLSFFFLNNNVGQAANMRWSFSSTSVKQWRSYLGDRDSLCYSSNNTIYITDIKYTISCHHSLLLCSWQTSLIKSRLGLSHLLRADSTDQYHHKKGNLFAIPCLSGSLLWLCQC